MDGYEVRVNLREFERRLINCADRDRSNLKDAIAAEMAEVLVMERQLSRLLTSCNNASERLLLKEEYDNVSKYLVGLKSLNE